MQQQTQYFSSATREADFMRLLNDNKARILRVCRSYTTTREDSEDLFQEITIQLWHALPSFRGEAHLSTWLYRIALNAALRFAQRTKRQKIMQERLCWIEELELPPTGRDEALQERIEALQRCIHRLPEQDRAVMILYLEECSYKEIHQITGLSESNIGVKINRIKQTLLKCMVASGIQPMIPTQKGE